MLKRLVSKRQFSNSVYLWASAPRLGPKSSDIRTQFQFPRGKPMRVEALDQLNPQRIFVGMRHTGIISEDGLLYMFGSGNWGVLGQGNEDNVSFNKPILVSKFEKMGLKIKDVALGEYHTIALDEKGDVWTWGYAGKKGLFNWMYSQEIGALGHGDKEPHFTPIKVKFFEENGIKIKSISAGLYHCNALSTEGSLYTWGRGLNGVLGNGSNSHALEPILNEDIEGFKEEDVEMLGIKTMKSADEYSAILLNDGTLHSWGKNDRGQMGTGAGVGIEMVECENMPTQVDLKDENDVPQLVKNFTVGQNTMMIQDTENQIYLTGLKLHYTPKKLQFDPEILDVNNIKILASGRKHYICVTNDNNFHVWGDVFKGKTDPDSFTEGFDLHYGDQLFEQGNILDLECRYGTFGALVKH